MAEIDPVALARAGADQTLDVLEAVGNGAGDGVEALVDVVEAAAAAPINVGGATARAAISEYRNLIKQAAASLRKILDATEDVVAEVVPGGAGK